MDRHATEYHYRRGEHGQVLILAVVALVLVVIAAMLLFDVQTVIRGKIKGQNGMDAAALSAAEWQRHSLNLIGELNLVRATGTLISDVHTNRFFANAIKNAPEESGNSAEFFAELPWSIPLEEFTLFPEKEEFYYPDGTVNMGKLIEEIVRVEKEKRYLDALNRLVSQLQTRIAFVGPLIAFGAAQQAATNNQVFSNGDTGLLLNEYLRIISEDRDGNYDGVDSEKVNDYFWRGPYLYMLQSIFNDNKGIPAATRFNFVGMPVFSSDPPSPLSGYLGNKGFYQAIIGRNWCELDPILDLDLSGNWWSDFQQATNGDFSRQSEILPLHIRFSDSASTYDNAYNAEAFDGPSFSDTFNDIDPYNYQEAMSEVVDEQRESEGNKRVYHTYTTITIDVEKLPPLETYVDRDDRRYDFLPHLSWAVFDYEWRSYSNYQRDWADICLEGKIKDGMDYQSGARAYFEARQNIVALSTEGSVGRARESSFTNNILSLAEAKPIGRIKLKDSNNNSAYRPPFEAGRMVLPVFDGTALIPISLEPPSGNISMNDINWFYYLTEFVPLLSGSPTLEEAWDRARSAEGSHWQRYQHYYNALRDLNNPEFHKRGREWLSTPTAWETDARGNRRPIRTRRDDCNVQGGGPVMATPSLN